MRLLIGSLYTFLLAAVIGLGSTWIALTRNTGFGTLQIGGFNRDGCIINLQHDFDGCLLCSVLANMLFIGFS